MNQNVVMIVKDGSLKPVRFHGFGYVIKFKDKLVWGAQQMLKEMKQIAKVATRIFILVNCELVNLIVLFILSHDIAIILIVSIIMFIIYGE
jgi:hypothetical protein